MPRKILYLTWTGHIGGAETALVRLAGSLDRAKFKAEIWQLNPGPLSDLLRKFDLEVRTWNLKRMRRVFFNFPFHFQLIKYLKENNVKIIHANGTLAYLSGYFAARVCRIPIAWWLVDLPEGRDRNERLAGQLRADLIICNSQATREAFHGQYPGNLSPCEVVYPSVDIPRASSQSGEILKEEKLGLKGNPPVVLWAGRFQHWKGPEILVRSIPEVIKKYPETIFVFAGDSLPGMEDGSRQAAENLTRELGVSANVRFLGFRQDIGDLIDLTDVMVHTSLKPEPFGLVIAEAMARGKVVIAADQGGPTEMIDHGKNGWLIPPSNPEILARALNHLLANSTLRESIGNEAKKKAAHFDLNFIARQMEENYEKITKKKGMKIAILRPLPDPRRWSMDLYSRELAKALKGVLSSEDELIIFPSENETSEWSASAGGVIGKLQRWWQQYVLYGFKILFLKADIYHITDHGYGNLIPFLRGKKVVVTFHDALLPRLGQKKIPVKWCPRTAIWAQCYSLKQMAKSDHILTVSHFSKQELLDFCKFPSERITPVYHGLDPIFFKPAGEKKELLRKEWKLEKKNIVLLTGRSDPHKNVEGTLRVFSRMVKEFHLKDTILLKIGDSLTVGQRELADRLDIRDFIVEKGSLPFSQIPAVYQMSKAVVFLSWYEGFGLPVLEAMASGVPILISNRGSLPEVSGAHALMTDPADEECSAKALFSLLTDVKFRSELIDKGRQWVSQFVWEKTARQVEEIYRSI